MKLRILMKTEASSPRVPQEIYGVQVIKE